MKDTRAMTPLEKGNLLESAVGRIEQAIHQSAPGFSSGVFSIESKKIVNCGGVRHEIDVYVTAALPAGYSSTFIFECKNWIGTVGKNEIIVFQEKIEATKAQTGFFVSSRFSRDAVAQAKKSSRLVLLTAKHYEPIARFSYPRFHSVDALETNGNVSFRRDRSRRRRKPFDLDSCELLLQGQKLDAAVFCKNLIDELYQSELSRFDSLSAGEGIHNLKFRSSREYAD